MSEATHSNPLLNAPTPATGDSIFHCLTGTFLDAYFAPYAMYGEKKVDGCFFHYTILPDPGEKCLEHLGKTNGLLVRFLSAGSYNKTKVGVTPSEELDLSLPLDQQRGNFLIPQGGRTDVVQNSRFGVFIQHIQELIAEGELDADRFANGDIAEALVGVRAHFVGVDQPKWERKGGKKKGAADVFGGHKKDEEKEPEQIMVLDTIEGYLNGEELEKLKATAGSMNGTSTAPATTANPEHVATMEALVLATLSEKGKVELGDIAPMVAKALHDDSNPGVTPANRAEIMKLGRPDWLFSDERPWLYEGKTVTAAK